jgi:hypothetical protein
LIGATLLSSGLAAVILIVTALNVLPWTAIIIGGGPPCLRVLCCCAFFLMHSLTEWLVC